MCEDYRAGLRIDRAHEEADRAAGRQSCPDAPPSRTEDDIDSHGDRQRSGDPGSPATSSAPIHSGHHQAEQTPEELTQALIEFKERLRETFGCLLGLMVP